MSTISNSNIAEAIYLFSKDNVHVSHSEMYGKILRFLAHRRLFGRSKEILTELRKIINRDRGIVEVEITSATGLGENIRKDITHTLAKRYNAKEVVLIEKVNNRVLGGFRAESNGEVIDFTIKNKFKKLQEHLTRKL